MRYDPDLRRTRRRKAKAKSKHNEETEAAHRPEKEVTQVAFRAANPINLKP